MTHTILPTGDVKITDGQFTTNEENYKEFWYAMVGLAGESQNFDGNGHYVRFAVGGGSQTISTGKYGGAAGEKLYGRVNDPPLGTRPAYPGKRSPYNHTAKCKDQKLPDLNGAKTGPADGAGQATPTAPAVTTPSVATPAGTVPSTATTLSASSSSRQSLTEQLVDRLNPFRNGGGPVRTAIRKHRWDFVAVLGIIVVAVAVGSFILGHQRFYLPKWVPVVGTDFVDYKAEFATAQSVTPGQGQSVNVAGVPVGELSKVELKDGRAVITMKIRRKYAHVYKDATALLRPRPA